MDEDVGFQIYYVNPPFLERYKYLKPLHPINHHVPFSMHLTVMGLGNISDERELQVGRISRGVMSVFNGHLRVYLFILAISKRKLPVVLGDFVVFLDHRGVKLNGLIVLVSTFVPT